MDGIYIGLMSGTSLDGIDAVAVRFEPDFELLGSHSLDLPRSVKHRILTLCSPGDNEIDQLGELDQALAKLFAEATQTLISSLDLDRHDICAIGSHGQTIRHRPELGFTLQIGNPSLISEITNITTVADFRPRDVAAGGEGAPLVPAFHQALFQQPEHSRVILNIGGMSNITWLPNNTAEKVIGYDTGPGNVLLDAWIQAQQGKTYDKNGDWAASGSIDTVLLNQLLSLPYFAQPAPKSTGREQFNLAWLEEQIRHAGTQPSPQDVQATLLELTARSISDQILRFDTTLQPEVYVCGGGSHNGALLSRLRTLLGQHRVMTTDALNLHSDWVEAAAFAWLAMRTLSGLTGNLPDVTGASGGRILGAIYPA